MTAQLLEERSIGQVHLRMEQSGIAVLRESGSAKCRVPQGSHEAILINTSGGLAGGDRVDITAEASASALLTLTSQAAERVYRTLGPPAVVNIALRAGRSATMFWLPQETIFFEGSAMRRALDVDLDMTSTFLAVEPLVFGRSEMGEVVDKVDIRDHWRFRRGGKLVHAESFHLGPNWRSSLATLADNLAMANVVLISEQAEAKLDPVRNILGRQDGASAWNGKLVARLVARDSFHLRKVLIQVLSVCAGRDRLPKCWTF